MNNFIYNTIKNYSKKDIYPFHMPGHKRNKDFFKDFNFLDFDLTEFDEMDNLLNPEGIILNSERRASNFFGSYKSFFITNGSSEGILISIMSILNYNEKIIIARNSHKSAYNAMLLLSLNPIYVYPKITKIGLLGGIDPGDIEKAIIENMDAKVVFITSPTYEGFVYDIESISKITNKYNKILIVDEAHGAHFCLSDQLPNSAVKFADIVIQSVHKTLPAINQSAIIHINKKVDENLIKKNRAIFNTTSPSYIMLGMIDYLIEYFENNTDSINNYIKMIKNYREKLKKYSTISLINEKIINDSFIKDIDITKFTFLINSNKLTGKDIENKLRDEYKIQIELSSINHFIALSSICDTEEGFLKLEWAIKDLDNEIVFNKNLFNSFMYFNKIELCYNLAETSIKKIQKVKLNESFGKISKEFIVPYPPGIPIIVPGEIISSEIIKHIDILKNNNISFIGTEDSNLDYINVVKE